MKRPFFVEPVSDLKEIEKIVSDPKNYLDDDLCWDDTGYDFDEFYVSDSE
jgi:hypothetical protein